MCDLEWSDVFGNYVTPLEMLYLAHENYKTLEEYLEQEYEGLAKENPDAGYDEPVDISQLADQIRAQAMEEVLLDLPPDSLIPKTLETLGQLGIIGEVLADSKHAIMIEWMPDSLPGHWVSTIIYHDGSIITPSDWQQPNPKTEKEITLFDWGWHDWDGRPCIIIDGWPRVIC